MNKSNIIVLSILFIFENILLLSQEKELILVTPEFGVSCKHKVYIDTADIGNPHNVYKTQERLYSNEGRYGYRRIMLELRNRSITINHKTVLRLMSSEGIKCQVRIKKYRAYKGTNGTIASNILKRNFKSTSPNKKWTTDITEFALLGQKRYLSPIMDLYNGEIISYTISERPNLDMVINMLKKALPIKDKEQNLILHSDQGWHYQHGNYQKILKKMV